MLVIKLTVKCLETLLSVNGTSFSPEKPDDLSG